MEFKNVSAIHSALRRNRLFIKAFYSPGFYSTNKSVILQSVGANTLRAFKNDSDRKIKYISTPSSIYRTWADSVFFKKYYPTLLKVTDQSSFTRLHKSAVYDLSAYWKGEQKCTRTLDIAYACKLVDLLFKFIPLCKELDISQRSRIMNFIHCPLDSYTLKAIRHIWNKEQKPNSKFHIPRNAGMGLVENNYAFYIRLQDFIKDTMQAMNSSSIQFDLISYRKSEESENSFTLEPAKVKNKGDLT